MRPSVPSGDEVGRLNTPGHEAYLTECRWCRTDLRVLRGAVAYCPNCDRTHLMTTPPRDVDGVTRPEGTTA